MKHWSVKLTPMAAAGVRQQRKKGLLTKHDLSVLFQWLKEMAEFGPDFIQSSCHWSDHALEGKWNGYRASSFSSSGRIIYRILPNEIEVSVVRITAKHDYR